MTLTELYPQLFGKSHLQDGNVIDMAEHGRVGGISTGQGVKYVQILNDAGSVVSSFGGESSGYATITAIQGLAGTSAWRVTMATLPVVGDFSLSGAVDQGDAGSSAWLMTLATLPAFASQAGTWTVQPGNTPNTIGWLVTMASVSGKFSGWGGSLSVFQGSPFWQVTMATLPITGTVSALAAGGSLTTYQGGAPWLMTMATQPVSGTLGALNAGGSLTAFQGGTWNVFSSLASGTNYIAGGRYMPTLASLSSMANRELNLDLFGNLLVNLNSPLPNSTRINRTYSLASMASLMATPGAGKRLVIRELDMSFTVTTSAKLVEDQGGTPATVWGPHFFLPYAGITKTQCYIPITANKSLGLDVSGTGAMGVDLRVETENT